MRSFFLFDVLTAFLGKLATLFSAALGGFLSTVAAMMATWMGARWLRTQRDEKLQQLENLLDEIEEDETRRKR